MYNIAKITATNVSIGNSAKRGMSPCRTFNLIKFFSALRCTQATVLYGFRMLGNAPRTIVPLRI